MDALSRLPAEALKDGFIDGGIASHLRRTGKSRACVAVVTREAGEIWRKEIEAELEEMAISDEAKWYRGWDVGQSAESILCVLACARGPWASEGAVPHDSGDLGRCLRLLAKFPGWRERLPEVAARYPATKWPAIIARWSELESLDAPAGWKKQTAILNEINAAK